jgi:hypothetical protein
MTEPADAISLASMRELGVRSLMVTCKKCFFTRAVNVDAYDDSLTVPWFGPRMVCGNCGNKGADVRPNWAEQKLHVPSPHKSR